MKKYIKPEITQVILSTVGMIASSGDRKTDVVLSEETLNGVTFGSRQSTNIWEDEEDE